ncbi:hypothetical protein LOTGIDRAFT_140706 [Lottia gigantea]|uniref:Peptidase S54 rhomboid domain-containing protein n=1 Tax=Lottia gigantea TaxID=225164 RepID=V4A912_LOTGI|nr:hypothetical protein LOTGIDRAFT_140706 [Lottia gigantea]ESP00434.1 hypothetical protein LOTGIDRAFT_140706 [Lottia gigantea]
MCSERTSGENSVNHNLRPCCHHHHLSTCELFSHSHCIFIGGIFYRDKDHCSQVNCLDSLCGSNITTLYNKWIIMRPVEKCTGWFRLMLIYSICGLAGVLAASIISPYEPQVGSTAAVLGSIGVLIVQIIQAWNIIAKSRQQIAKVTFVVTFFLVSGLLPGLSNFSIITGIITGMLCAMVFLPYITLGRNQYHGRIVLLIISFPLLFMLLFVLIFTFLRVQYSEGCMGCQYFECMPFAEGICVE